MGTSSIEKISAFKLFGFINRPSAASADGVFKVDDGLELGLGLGFGSSGHYSAASDDHVFKFYDGLQLRLGSGGDTTSASDDNVFKFYDGLQLRLGSGDDTAATSVDNGFKFDDILQLRLGSGGGDTTSASDDHVFKFDDGLQLGLGSGGGDNTAASFDHGYKFDDGLQMRLGLGSGGNNNRAASDDHVSKIGDDFGLALGSSRSDTTGSPSVVVEMRGSQGSEAIEEGRSSSGKKRKQSDNDGSNKKRRKHNTSGKKSKGTAAGNAADNSSEIPCLDGIPELAEAIQANNGTNPVFLYRKTLQNSDVVANQNRLFLTKCEKLMNFLTTEEKKAVRGGGGLKLIGVGPNKRGSRSSSYNLELKFWGGVRMNVIKAEWGKLVADNNAQNGHEIQIWGYRQQQDGKLGLALYFNKTTRDLHPPQRQPQNNN